MSDFPAAEGHGELREIFDDVFFVTGGLTMPGRLPMRFSRNMTVVREDDRLVIINSMRLSPEGLEALDALGRVTDVLRVAGFHGRDDPFYADRYDADVWVVDGMGYHRGFETTGESYYTPRHRMTAATELPLRDARLHVFDVRPAEGIVVLEREGGILVPGDSLQNWYRTDEHFSLPAKLVMRGMGFIEPHNLGPGWIKAAKPPASELRRLLDLEFEHVLPAHGGEVIGGALEKFRPTIERRARR